MSEINLSPVDIHNLEIYKSIVEGKPVSMSFEDMQAVASLKDEIEQAMENSKPIFEEIEAAKAEIQAAQEKIKQLVDSIDPKVVYLHTFEALQEKPKPVTRTTNGSNPINSESVMEVLKANPYGLGNTELLKKMSLPTDKSNQNKVYTVCKALESEGKVKSENRQWKIL